MAAGRWGSERKAAAGLALAVVILAGAAGVSWRSNAALVEASRSVAHTHEVLQDLHGLLGSITSAEAAQHGFVITGRDEYLAPYRDAVQAALDGLQRLRRRTADNPRQQAALEVLAPAVLQKLELVEQTARLRREAGYEAAAALVDNGRGLEAMRRIRGQIAGLEAEERSLLVERQRTAELSVGRAARLLAAGNVLSLGLVLGAYLLLRREIEQRRHAEAEATATARLQRLILDSIGDGVAVADRDGRLVSFNPAAERILGRGLIDAGPQDWHETYGVFLLDGVTPFPVERFPLVRALQGEAVDGEEQFIRNASVPEGILISVSARPLRDTDDVSHGAVAVFRDITRSKRAEESIRQLNAELEHHVVELTDLNKELESFSYSVSHDLRQPLRAIHGFARALAEDHGPALDPEARRYLDIVTRNASKMGELIDDLLAFSRLGRKEMDLGPVDMERLAAEVIGELQEGSAASASPFVLAPLPPARADRPLVREVLANLLGNALKYSRKREQPRIEVGALPGEAFHTYVVRDNGVGFDMQYADKLFGIFQRLHAAAEFEGTGVGLALVQRLVHRHGGRVWAESEPERGATFYFTLPAA